MYESKRVFVWDYKSSSAPSILSWSNSTPEVTNILVCLSIFRCVHEIEIWLKNVSVTLR
jgi:hypothetical protein